MRRLLLTICLVIANPGLGIDLRSFIDGCPTVKAAQRAHSNTFEDETYYSLLAWEEFVPRIRAQYSQRQLLIGPRTNITFGLQGTLANPIRTYSLVGMHQANWKQRLEGARGDLLRHRMEFVKLFFDWKHAQKISSIESRINPILNEALDGIAKHQTVHDISTTILDLQEAKLVENRLLQKLKVCGESPSQVQYPVPARQELEAVSQELQKNLPEQKSCEAMMEQESLMRRSIQWSWLPNLVYSYSHATPISQNNFAFTEWAVGVELSLPLTVFAGKAPASHTCEVRAASEARKLADLALEAEISFDRLPQLEKLSQVLEKVLLRYATEEGAPLASAQKHIELLQTFLRTERTARDSLIAIHQIWIAGRQL